MEMARARRLAIDRRHDVKNVDQIVARVVRAEMAPKPVGLEARGGRVLDVLSHRLPRIGVGREVEAPVVSSATSLSGLVGKLFATVVHMEPGLVGKSAAKSVNLGRSGAVDTKNGHTKPAPSQIFFAAAESGSE